MISFNLIVSFVSLAFYSILVFWKRSFLKITMLEILVGLCLFVSAIISSQFDHLEATSFNTIFQLFAVIYIIKNFLDSLKLYNNTITTQSIRQAINNLPYGVVLYDVDENIILVNKVMMELGLKIYEDFIMDMNGFWDQINKGNPFENIASLDLGTHPLLSMPDKEVWQFQKEEVWYQNQHFIQIFSLNITDLYRLLIEVETESKTLSNQRLQLLSVLDNVIEIHKQEEVLDYKIKIHSGMGEVILSSAMVISQNLDLVHLELEKWRYLVHQLENSFEDQKEQSTENALASLIQAGEKIDCRIEIHGEFPHHKSYASMLVNSIREAVLNAKKHGNATQVTIEIQELKPNTEILIYDNGTFSKEYFEMSGGLLTLKEEVENHWGQVQFYPHDGFTILMRFPY